MIFLLFDLRETDFNQFHSAHIIHVTLFFSDSSDAVRHILQNQHLQSLLTSIDSQAAYVLVYISELYT